MGQALSEPVTGKRSSRSSDDMVCVGASCMQGWRVTMEDAHTILLQMPGDPGARFFAVYDGHGGSLVAQYAGQHLHEKIVKMPEYGQSEVAEAMRRAFLELDHEMLNDASLREELAGSTAITVLLKDKKMYCANVGDSRAIACVRGQVEELSHDHKPMNDNEVKRIISAGGWVEMNRVNGSLALSRALGDFVFKRNEKKRAEEQVVTAYPDVVTRDLTPDHEFVVLACDGIWDVMSNQEVVDFIRYRIQGGLPPDEICEDLMTTCLSPDCQMGGLGCDNMTVVIVCLLNGGTYEDLCQKCGRLPLTILPEYEDSDEFDEEGKNSSRAQQCLNSVAISDHSPSESSGTSDDSDREHDARPPDI